MALSPTEKIYIGQNGEAFKAFNVKDGCGIHDLAMPEGIIPVIITARSSGIVKNCCDELGITEVYQGCKNKLETLKDMLNKYSRQDGTIIHL